MSKEEKRYDKMYKLPEYANYKAAQGPKYINTVLKLVGKKIHSILDVGCGPGYSVREFLKKGYDCKGVETSDYLIKNKLRDLVKKKIVFKRSATNLKFSNNSFDLIFCTDVMEHLSEREIKKAIKEMSRVSRKYLFFTISYAPSDFKEGGKNLHLTVRPRKWWIREIEKIGKVKLISPNFPWNFIVNNKTLKFKFIKNRNYFLFEK